ncbi:MAG: sigma-54 dependent transcriptional regulator, partial [Mariprofundaceae bacterium]
AVEFIHKPIDIDELDRVMDKLAAHAREADDDKVLRLEPDMEGAAVVGRSRLMQEIFKLIGKVSQTRSTVLIEGESGTGKELIARAIHDNTPKTTGPFVAINCAAIVDNLLESELFGHEKGAFTDAVTRKDGKFTLAGGGTLFLDEIGDMPANLQAKLLRVLQERCFERVGGKDMLPFKARLITATNRHLEEEVKKGNFREDLYYRLNVVRIHVPPLRERREDIPVLVAHLLNKISKDVGKLVTRIPVSVMADLVAYDWPGNVREMENMLVRAVVMTDSDILHVDLPGGQERLAASASFPDAVVESAIFRSLAEVESEHIGRTLRATGWHKGQACDVLGISRPRLERKISLYKLKRT